MLSATPTCETCRYWQRANDGMGSGICSRASPHGVKRADGNTYTDRLSACQHCSLLGVRRA